MNRAVCLLLCFLVPAGLAAKQSTVRLRLKVFPLSAQIFIKNFTGAMIRKGPDGERRVDLPAGSYEILLSAPGYFSKSVKVTLSHAESLLEEKLEKTSSPFQRILGIACGHQPKSVEFTPDGRYLVTALLQGEGAEVYSSETFKKIADLRPPQSSARQQGFVETAFSLRRQEIWVSQMTSHEIHVFSLKNFAYLGSFSTEGIWSKVIVFTPDEKTALVSNWISQDISVINTAERKVVQKIKTDGIPRGMAVTPDLRHVYAAVFSTGKIEKIRIADWKTEKVLDFGRGAKRHMVLNPKTHELYISDMGRGSVFVLDTRTDRLLAEIPVDKKLNTIALSEDGLYLFASSRGPNGKNGYLNKGQEFGKVYVICTQSRRVLDWIWGKNQPTGLALSPDGKTLAFTNFLDHEIEVYRVFLAPPGYWQLQFPWIPAGL